MAVSTKGWREWTGWKVSGTNGTDRQTDGRLTDDRVHFVMGFPGGRFDNNVVAVKMVAVAGAHLSRATYAHAAQASAVRQQ